MSSVFVLSLMAALQSMLKLLVIYAIGISAAHIGLLNQQVVPQISNVNFLVFSPALILVNLTRNVDIERLKVYWPVVFWCVLSISLGAMIANLFFSKILRIRKEFVPTLVTAVAFSNSGTLTFIIMQSLTATTLFSVGNTILPAEIAENYNTVLSMAFTFSIFWNILFYAKAYFYLLGLKADPAAEAAAKQKDQEEEEARKAAEHDTLSPEETSLDYIPQQQGGQQQQQIDLQITGGTEDSSNAKQTFFDLSIDIDDDERYPSNALFVCFGKLSDVGNSGCDAFGYFINKFFLSHIPPNIAFTLYMMFTNPPFVAIVIAIIVGLTPPLKHVFFEGSLKFVIQALEFVSGISVPIGALITSANIYFSIQKNFGRESRILRRYIDKIEWDQQNAVDDPVILIADRDQLLTVKPVDQQYLYNMLAAGGAGSTADLNLYGSIVGGHTSQIINNGGISPQYDPRMTGQYLNVYLPNQQQQQQNTPYNQNNPNNATVGLTPMVLPRNALPPQSPSNQNGDLQQNVPNLNLSVLPSNSSHDTNTPRNGGTQQYSNANDSNSNNNNNNNNLISPQHSATPAPGLYPNQSRLMPYNVSRLPYTQSKITTFQQHWLQQAAQQQQQQHQQIHPSQSIIVGGGGGGAGAAGGGGNQIPQQYSHIPLQHRNGSIITPYPQQQQQQQDNTQGNAYLVQNGSMIYNQSTLVSPYTGAAALAAHHDASYIGGAALLQYGGVDTVRNRSLKQKKRDTSYITPMSPFIVPPTSEFTTALGNNDLAYLSRTHSLIRPPGSDLMALKKQIQQQQQQHQQFQQQQQQQRGNQPSHHHYEENAYPIQQQPQQNQQQQQHYAQYVSTPYMAASPSPNFNSNNNNNNNNNTNTNHGTNANIWKGGKQSTLPPIAHSPYEDEGYEIDEEGYEMANNNNNPHNYQDADENNNNNNNNEMTSGDLVNTEYDNNTQLEEQGEQKQGVERIMDPSLPVDFDEDGKILPLPRLSWLDMILVSLTRLVAVPAAMFGLFIIIDIIGLNIVLPKNTLFRTTLLIMMASVSAESVLSVNIKAMRIRQSMMVSLLYVTQTLLCLLTIPLWIVVIISYSEWVIGK